MLKEKILGDGDSMCGRYTLIAPFVLIIQRFHTAKHIEASDYMPNYNIAPGSNVMAVVNDGRENRLGLLRWGLIPPWADDEKIGYKLINARAESLSTRASFRSAYQKKRCLILADSFYEWKRDTSFRKTKQPIRFQLRTGELFAMAGLWESWQNPDGRKVFSCTIITTEANPLMAPIHQRMPVILHKEDEADWLDPKNQDIRGLNQLLHPFEEELMLAYPVSQAVNSTRNNGPELIQSI